MISYIESPSHHNSHEGSPLNLNDYYHLVCKERNIALIVCYSLFYSLKSWVYSSDVLYVSSRCFSENDSSAIMHIVSRVELTAVMCHMSQTSRCFQTIANSSLHAWKWNNFFYFRPISFAYFPQLWAGTPLIIRKDFAMVGHWLWITPALSASYAVVSIPSLSQLKKGVLWW